MSTVQGISPPVNARRPRRKVQTRTLRWHSDNCCLCINVDGVVTGYTVSPVHASIGAAFYLDKEDDQGSHYLVEVAGDRASCGCLSFRRWRKCKHEAAIRKLIELSKLPSSTQVLEP